MLKERDELSARIAKEAAEHEQALKALTGERDGLLKQIEGNIAGFEKERGAHKQEIEAIQAKHDSLLAEHGKAVAGHGQASAAAQEAFDTLNKKHDALLRQIDEAQSGLDDAQGRAQQICADAHGRERTPRVAGKDRIDAELKESREIHKQALESLRQKRDILLKQIEDGHQALDQASERTRSMPSNRSPREREKDGRGKGKRDS